MNTKNTYETETPCEQESDYSRYTLINYFDIWGNADDGWEINDECAERDDLVIADDASDKDILIYLKQIGFLATDDMRRLVVEDLVDCIEIYERKGMRPLCSLRRNERRDDLNEISDRNFIFVI